MPDSIGRDRTLKAPSKLAYYYLWNWSLEQNPVSFTYEELGAQCGESASSARAWVRKLVEVGRVEWVDKPRSGVSGPARVRVKAPESPTVIGRRSPQLHLPLEAQNPAQDSTLAKLSLKPAQDSTPEAQNPAQVSSPGGTSSDAAAVPPIGNEAEQLKAFNRVVEARQRSWQAHNPAQVSSPATYNHDHDSRKISKNHNYDHEPRGPDLLHLDQAALRRDAMARREEAAELLALKLPNYQGPNLLSLLEAVALGKLTLLDVRTLIDSSKAHMGENPAEGYFTVSWRNKLKAPKARAPPRAPQGRA